MPASFSSQLWTVLQDFEQYSGVYRFYEKVEMEISGSGFLQQVIHFGASGEEENSALWEERANFDGDLDSVEAGHINIAEKDIGVPLGRQVDRG